MKTKYLFLAAVAFALAACTDTTENLPQNDQPTVEGAEKGYISINLQAEGAVRAAGASYEDGTTDEQAVNNATFYFFDAAGNPFNINASGNYFNVSVADNGTTQAPNIESMTNPVLVVEKYKGEFPASIVAVVNYIGTSSLSLAELRDNLSDVGHSSGTNFIMTNSVYADGAGNAVYATPLTIDNFQTSAAAATDNPVTIHIERIVAKMSVSAGNTAFNTGVQVNGKNVFARVSGWEVISNPMESYFIKTIDTNWDDTTLGFTWNDIPYLRSYWTGKSLTASNHAFAYNDLVNSDASVEYLGEHVGAANTERTKFIIGAQLQDENGSALEIAQWYGTSYITEDALLAAVAPTLKQKFMQFDGIDTYTNIDDSQLQCVAGNANAESYEVVFQLAEGVATDNWYSFDGENYTPIADVNAELVKIEPAKIWKDGMTYYYGDVKHIGIAGSVGEFGIVRNHSYKVSITGVKGWGTPIYDPTLQVVPVKPTDKETYIAAEINVLSWRVVSQDVTLQ
ncbi:MAG: Mfa1 fimbrilin C-terminal domain-containing protein [Alistipes sp.]|nr:Mfa1 fimbrilin C-terminal domain-containing protein [Alistipes sp.]